MKRQLFLLFLVTVSQNILSAASSSRKAMPKKAKQFLVVTSPLLQEFYRDPAAFDLSIQTKFGQPDFGERLSKSQVFLNELRMGGENMQAVLLRALNDRAEYVLKLLINIPGLKDFVLYKERSIETDAERTYSVTPVMNEVFFHRHKQLSMLLDAGACPNGTCKERGVTPLFVAVCNGDQESVNLLLASGADPNIARIDNFSPLHVAVQSGNIDIAKALVEKNANVHHQQIEGSSALYMAAELGNEELVSLLLSAGAKVNQTNNENHTPLYRAADSNHEGVVRQLLDSKADPNIVPDTGFSPLHMAAQQGFTRIVQLLLQAGANYTDVSLSGKCNVPLIVSIKYEHTDVVKHLLALDAVPFIWTDRKITVCHALGLAVWKNMQPILALLEPYKELLSTLHIKDEYGDYPIHYACMRPTTGALQFFLSSNVDIHVHNNHKETPLYIAAMENNIAAVKLLCEAGANTQAKNILGLTPLDIAQANGCNGVVRFLQNYKAPTMRSATLVASSSQASSSRQDALMQEQSVASCSSEPKKQVGSSSAKTQSKRRNQRGQSAVLEDIFTVAHAHKEQDTNEVFALRQPEQHMTVVVYKGDPYKLPETSNVCNMSRKTDNFHAFSVKVNECLNRGIYIDAKNKAHYAYLLADLGINKLKGFVIILPGKIESEQYDARYALIDKEQVTRGRDGAFVYLFDKNGRCYHRCFHENHESKRRHMFD